MDTKDLVGDALLQRFISEWIIDDHIINKYGHPNQYDRSQQVEITLDIIFPRNEDGYYIGGDEYINLDRYHGEKTYYDNGNQSNDTESD